MFQSGLIVLLLVGGTSSWSLSVRRQCVLRPLRGPIIKAQPGVGALAEIEGSTTLCIVDGADPKNKKNIVVRTYVGREQTVRSISSKAFGHVVALGRSATPADVLAHSDARDAALSASDLDESLALAWEMLDTKGSPVSLSELSELLKGDVSSCSRYATYSMLNSPAGRLYFRTKDDGEVFIPRDEADSSRLVAAAKAAAAKEAEEAAVRATVAATIKAREADPGIQLDVSAAGGREAWAAVERLGCYALEPAVEEEPAHGFARAFLKEVLHWKATPEGARGLLVAVGVWGLHEELDLVRRRVPRAFDDAAIREAAALAHAPPPDRDAGRRRDLTHLDAFAIDDASTVEVRPWRGPRAQCR